MNDPIWEKEIEVPPRDEQIGTTRRHRGENDAWIITKVNKEVIVDGGVATANFLGMSLAWELDNLSPGEYKIQIVEDG